MPINILERMRYLEEIDARDRQDGTPHLKRLRQIPPETGRFIAILAASAPRGTYIEIGTSAGYSTLWLALACRMAGRRIITFEALDEKFKLAQETFKAANVNDVVELVRGDARDYLNNYADISFCFLDAEKTDYLDFYERLIPQMLTGGLLVVDNVISHREIVQPTLDRALSDKRVDALVVPIGKGELICRKN
jgi:caffeoyl-CoA O-methyltransferase